MTNIVFGTWNAGSGGRDYWQLFSNREKEASEQPSAADLMKARDEEFNHFFASLNTIRDKLLQASAVNLSREGDVFALQEVYGDHREDIKALRERGFKIIRPSNNAMFTETNTAIAIRTNRFEDIENRSYSDRGGFAIVVATERNTDKKIAFISAHIQGFDLEASPHHHAEEAAIGDEDISYLLNYLETNGV